MYLRCLFERYNSKNSTPQRHLKRHYTAKDIIQIFSANDALGQPTHYCFVSIIFETWDGWMNTIAHSTDFPYVKCNYT